MKTSLILFFLSFSAYSKTYLPRELADLAVARTPYMKMFGAGLQASEFQVKQSRMLANPIAVVQTGQVHNSGQKGDVIDLTLSQPLPWPGKREAFIRSQEFLSKVANTELEEARFVVAHKVILIVYEIAALDALEKHNAERKRRFDLVTRYLSSRLMASPKQIIDRDIIQTQLKILQKNMEDLSARKTGLLEELSLWTGEREIVIEMDWNKIPPLPEKEKYLTGLEDSLRYKRLKTLQNFSESRVDEARLMARPDLVVGVNYRQENIAPANRFYHAQLAVVIPLIDYGQHSVEVAKAQVRREDASKRMFLNESEAKVHQLFYLLMSHERNMKLFEVDQVKSLEQKFERAETAFRKNQIDALTFIQMDSQVHESLDIAFSSRSQYLSTLSELETMMGRQLEL